MAIPFFSESSAVVFRIRHTARTLGADIEALLTGYIQNFLKKDTKLKEIIQKHSGKLGLLFRFILFISSLITCFYSATQARINQLAYIKTYLGDTISINQKIDFLMQLNATGFWGSYYFYVFVFITVTFLMTVFLSIWVAESASASKSSHILLTKKSEEHKKILDKKYERKWYSFVISLFVSILTGIVTNIIFTFIW